MAKGLFPAYKEARLDSSAPNLSAVDIVIVATDSTYVRSDTHDFLDDVLGSAIIATSPALTGVDITDGTLDADDTDLGAPAGGDTIAQLLYVVDTGVDSTSRLLAYTDEDASAASLAISTNGETISLSVHADGLFT